MAHWSQVQVVRSRLADEAGTLVKDAPLRVALCYPSPYHVGMSSLGFQALYREIHAHPGATAERAFLPDDIPGFRSSGAPLFTYETQSEVSRMGIIAFSVAYELELPGVLEMLELAGLPLLRAERSGRHPLVIAGGPLTFSNPAPLEPFVDAIALGEAEALIHELLEIAGAGVDRSDLLAALSRRPGFHVPEASSVPPRVVRAPDERLPATSQILTPHTELRSMFLVEAERGCSRGCTYCVMRRTTNGGMRTVAAQKLLGLIPESARRVGLVGAAVTDHPELPRILRDLVDSGREIGISSLRADRLTPEIMGLLARGGYRTLTVASDGASQRLRDAVNRNTQEKHLLRCALLARAAGIPRLKLYALVGLPNEAEADIDELATFACELSRIVPVSLGIAPFCAKRNTPLDGAPFEAMAVVEGRLAHLRRKVKGRVEIRSTSARWAFVEYMLAQSGPEAGLAALDAWRAGGSFASWKRAFEAREVAPRRAAGAAGVADDRRQVPSSAWRPSAGAT
jgi:radical SAM superfamily enzyme YgiQ (UPF0313 family)